MARLLISLYLLASLAHGAQDTQDTQNTQLIVDRWIESSIPEEDPPVVETEALIALAGKPVTVGRTFRVKVDTAGPYMVEMRAFYFDSYLVLRDGAGNVIAEDDNGLIGTHSRLVIAELEPGVSYSIDACALKDGRGPFDLILKRGAPPAATVAAREALEVEVGTRRIEVIEKVAGTESTALASAVTSLAIVYWGRGDFARARPHFERALELWESALGPEAPDTAAATSNLASVLVELGDFDEASRLHERALAIREKVLGPEHYATFISLNNIASMHQTRNDWAAAQPYAERALAAREATLGVDHPDLVMPLSRLALIRQTLADYDGAQGLLERALAINNKAFGPDHPQTAQSIRYLGYLLGARGDHAAARPLHERDLATQEKSGTEQDVLAALRALARAVEFLGDREALRSLNERAIAYTERVFGPEHPETASCLTRAAMALTTEGAYPEARALLERALEICEKTRGREHLETAFAVTCLAQVYHGQGDYESARPLFERALEIREKVQGPRNPAIAPAIHDLAVVYAEVDDLASARRFYERALAIRATLADADNDRVFAFILKGLGSVLYKQGEVDAAIPLLERALAIRERVLGEEHPEVAEALNTLAMACHNRGNTGLSRLHIERAIAIRQKTDGPASRGMAVARINLARQLFDSGELFEAWEMLQRASRDRRARIETTLASLSEGERYSYLAHLLWQFEFQLSLASAIGNARVRTEAYDAVLEWKGRIGRLVASSREQLTSRMGVRERAMLDDLRRSQAELSKRVLATEIPDRELHDRRLAELRDECGRAERALHAFAASTGGFQPATFRELKSKLETGSAIIDFFAYRLYQPGEYRTIEASPRHTSVWITRPDRDVPIEVRLGPTTAIDTAVRTFLEDLVANRGVVQGAGPEDDPGAELRALLWDPIALHLEGIKTVFVSPDGALGTLPFEVLPLADGSFAVENLAFVYAQDASTLLHARDHTGKIDSLLAVGAVDFKNRSKWEPSEKDAKASPPEVPETLMLASSPLRGSFTEYWFRLPATGRESQVVSEIHKESFGVDGRRLLLQGDQPGEKRLKYELTRHAALHLATHGYFQPKGMPSMWDSARNEAGKRVMRMSDEARHLVGKHPGLLSGLVCAGANRGGENGGEDGYLTAEEVAWLDLSGVELVVLSACETGLGTAQSGEGLIGLRRAFRMAGAKTVISSLWSVKDDSTAVLMRDFYANLWLRGMARHEALRAAQLTMLKRNRIEFGEGLPSTWGAFVLAGEWRR